MSSSKRDLLIIMRVFQDFIENLSNLEYENLINGNGMLKYIDKKISTEDKSNFDSIIEKLLKQEYQQPFDFLKNNQYLNSKLKYIELCRYLNIDVKPKDSIDVICKKTIDFVDQNRHLLQTNFEKKTDINYIIQTISYRLEELSDPHEAINYLVNHEVLSTKANLLSLAKQLEVYVPRDGSNEDIIKKIVDSVVVAKLRSKAIRGKINKSFFSELNQKE